MCWLWFSTNEAKNNLCKWSTNDPLDLDAAKPIFGVSDKVRFKPVSSATETSYTIKISHVAGLDMILFSKQITKALIRMSGCAGWFATLLFITPLRQVYSRRGPFVPNCFKIRSVDSDKKIFTGFPFGYHGNTNSVRIFVKEDYPSIIPVKFGEISTNDLGDVIEPTRRALRNIQ